MEKLAELLKVFLEKHLIPTVISIMFAIVCAALTPSNFIIIEKLGLFWQGILAFCVCFIFTQIIIAIFRCRNKKEKYKQSTSVHSQRIKLDNMEALERLWTYVDGRSPSDKELLMTFIQTNNKPIEQSGEIFGDCLLCSQLVNVTIVKPSQETQLIIGQPIEKSPKATRIPIGQMIFSQPVKQYKLKDDFYKLLKYSYDKYGRISHFNEGDTINGQA